MSILIRKMDELAERQWAEMRVKLWSELSDNDNLGNINTMVRGGKRVRYMVLLADKLPIGFAEICIREYVNGCTVQPIPFLEGIWVHPEHRHRGYSCMLIENISYDLKREGFHELCSDAKINNHCSRKAHLKWGFTETGRVAYFRKPL